MAVAAQREVQDLLAQSIGPACHELRSPLAVVYGFAKMLESGDLDETTARYVKSIVGSSERLDSMIDGLSKLGRIAAGRITPDLQPVALRSLTEDICSTTTNQKRVRAEVGADVQVTADAAWLSEAFQAVIDSVAFDDDIDMGLSWMVEAGEVVVDLTPRSSFPVIEVDPAKSSIGMSLARVQVLAMGGSFDGHSDRISITLPRHG